MEEPEELPETVLIYCHDKGTRDYFTKTKKILASFEGWGHTWVIHTAVGNENEYHVTEISSGCKIPVEASTIESAERAAKIFLSRRTRENINQTIINQREFVASRRFESR